VYVAVLVLWLLMLIQFSLLISSSSLSMLTSLRQESFLCCSVWMFCLYSYTSHESGENSSVIVHQCNSDSESGVLISVSCLNCQAHDMTLFWNVVVHQNISWVLQ
jgi:hypothetical protein